MTAAQFIFRDWRMEPPVMAVTMDSLVWLSQVDAEELFLPEDFVKPQHTPWEPAMTLGLLKHYAGKIHRPAPVRAEAKQGRNEACNCGSGRKFKVCCGVG